MSYLELAKMQLQAIDGEHPITEIQVRALVAIADALVALVELLAGEDA